MKAENLLVIASSRGMRLELSRPKRDIPYAHKRPPRRRDVVPATPDKPGNPGIPGVLTGEGRQTRTSKEPEWLPSDLGFACSGMPDRQWRVLCWAVALEESSRAWLKGELLMTAVEIKDREGWPDEIKRGSCPLEIAPGVRCGAQRTRRYLEDLVELALIEVAEPHRFDFETVRARWFGVQQHTWDRHVSAHYQAIARRPKAWFKRAIRYINWRLESREFQVGAA